MDVFDEDFGWLDDRKWWNWVSDYFFEKRRTNLASSCFEDSSSGRLQELAVAGHADGER